MRSGPGGDAITITSITPLAVTHGTGRETMSFFFVRVETDDGLVGYGEACDSYGCSYASVLATVVDDVLAPLLVGQELTAVAPLAQRLRLFTRRRLGDQWVGPQARSAVEIALWDLLGQRCGTSVSSIIGRVRDEVEVYASSVFLEEGPAAFHHELLGPLLERGVRRVKVRTGPAWRHDLATLAELRALLGDDVELMVDGSETYTLPTALEIAHGLAGLGVSWFEEPLPQPNRAGIEELVRRSPVAIAYGEHLYGSDDALDAMRRGQLGVLQPDASTAGGISEAREMAAKKKPSSAARAQQDGTRVAQRLASIGASQAQRHVTAAEQAGGARYLDPTSAEWEQAVQLVRAVTITRAKRRDTITHGEVRWVILDELRMLVRDSSFEELLVAIGQEGDAAPLAVLVVHPNTGAPTEDYLLAAMELGFDAPLPTLQRQVYEHFR